MTAVRELHVISVKVGFETEMCMQAWVDTIWAAIDMMLKEVGWREKT